MDSLFLALRVLVSLAAVLGLLWFLRRRVVRHTGSRGQDNPVSVVARHGISPKASVVVVETDGKRFLLGVTEQSVNVLHTSDAPQAAFAEQLDLLTGVGGRAEPDGGMPPAALNGSILSPGTWKQTASFLRTGRGG